MHHAVEHRGVHEAAAEDPQGFPPDRLLRRQGPRVVAHHQHQLRREAAPDHLLLHLRREAGAREERQRRHRHCDVVDVVIERLQDRAYDARLLHPHKICGPNDVIDICEAAKTATFELHSHVTGESLQCVSDHLDRPMIPHGCASRGVPQGHGTKRVCTRKLHLHIVRVQLHGLDGVHVSPTLQDSVLRLERLHRCEILVCHMQQLEQ
mmetsp:Transcript_64457/g.181360  ORF Transcript_64457/g.181360 Transcript_64457/m.181360 type:complete len:208 (-) Transcript_64457:372-995(-)